jgi:anti-anti-sigma factor
MTRCKSVVVSKLPETLDAKSVPALLNQLLPQLQDDRPCVVFDFSETRTIDSAAVDMLLRCMEEALKRNGDVKLAAVGPEVALILEMTKVSRLFETFDNLPDAVESFHNFSFGALQQTWTPDSGVTV